MTDLLHVVPAPGGGWAVRARRARRISRKFAERAEAIRWAIDRAPEAVVHRSDGSIGWVESWYDEEGNDTRTRRAQ